MIPLMVNLVDPLQFEVIPCLSHKGGEEFCQVRRDAEFHYSIGISFSLSNRLKTSRISRSPFEESFRPISLALSLSVSKAAYQGTVKRLSKDTDSRNLHNLRKIKFISFAPTHRL